jgi:hypothetical protein
VIIILFLFRFVGNKTVICRVLPFSSFSLPLQCFSPFFFYSLSNSYYFYFYSYCFLPSNTSQVLSSSFSSPFSEQHPQPKSTATAYKHFLFVIFSFMFFPFSSNCFFFPFLLLFGPNSDDKTDSQNINSFENNSQS